jgi:hypothetical protein
VALDQAFLRLFPGFREPKLEAASLIRHLRGDGVNDFLFR